MYIWAEYICDIFLKDCFPGRYKEIHFVNESVVLRALWTIVRNFISSKMRNRVSIN